jgi:hypothetical protein
MIAIRPLPKPAVSFLWLSKASISSGGYSLVVKTVYRMDNKNMTPPIAKATLTFGGITDSAAVLLIPHLI